MNTRSALYAILVIWLIGGSACKKREDASPTIDISILSPSEQDVFNTGDTLHVHASIKSPVELHGYTWELHNEADNSILASAAEHTHGQTFEINDTWVTNVTENVQAALVFTVEIDHNGNTSSKTVQISCKP